MRSLAHGGAESDGRGQGPGTLTDVDDVAQLYAEEAIIVRRLVRREVVASPALIEDACQVAWTRLLIHRARVRRDSARAWLVRVAVHDALRCLERDRRLRSLEATLDLDVCELRGGGDAGSPATVLRPAPPSLQDIAEARDRLDAIRSLPVRQRRLLWLQGLGLSYREMAGATGMTRRTVERQLMRARSSLAKAGR